MPTCGRKRALRREVREAVLAVTPDDRAEMDQAIYGHLLGATLFAHSRVVMLYASAFPEEVPTRPLMAGVLAAGKELVLPRVRAEAGEMDLCRLTDPEADLLPGRYGIMEPGPECPLQPARAVGLVIVPGLAFDRAGYRLGRGGGYYDRFLDAPDRTAVSCSVAYGVQLVDAVPREPHDRPVDFLVTEAGMMQAVRNPRVG